MEIRKLATFSKSSYISYGLLLVHKVAIKQALLLCTKNLVHREHVKLVNSINMRRWTVTLVSSMLWV